MKLISWNINGLRSVFNKGFVAAMNSMDPDIICLQEIKLQQDQLPQELFGLTQYSSYFHYARKKGYSGAAIFTKEKPLSVNSELGFERFDEEGRMLELEYKNFTLINFYIPNGGRSKENLDYKLECYRRIFEYIKRKKAGNLILCGDFNIAHTEIDLARPKENRNNIMFTPEERKQIDELVRLGFLDTFRVFDINGQNYTWWPYFYDARNRNLGWRIDYFFVSNSLKKNLTHAFILKNITGSDHCPVGIEVSD